MSTGCGRKGDRLFAGIKTRCTANAGFRFYMEPRTFFPQEQRGRPFAVAKRHGEGPVPGRARRSRFTSLGKALHACYAQRAMNSSCNACCAWLQKNGVSAGLLVLRLVVAAILVTKGSEKLFGGMGMFTGMVAGLGFPAPTLFAYLAALTEFVGGIALAFGLATRVVAPLGAITMLVAFFGVHNASFAMGGMAPFALFGACAALSLAGAGRWSVGMWMCRRKMGEGCCHWHDKSAMGCGCCDGKDGKDMEGCCKDEKKKK